MEQSKNKNKVVNLLYINEKYKRNRLTRFQNNQKLPNMKIKIVLNTLCVLFLMTIQSVNAAYIPVTLNKNDVSNLSITENEDGQYYDLSTNGATTQYVNTNPITQDLSTDYYTLSFEYQSSTISNHFQIWYGNEWSSSRTHA